MVREVHAAAQCQTVLIANMSSSSSGASNVGQTSSAPPAQTHPGKLTPPVTAHGDHLQMMLKLLFKPVRVMVEKMTPYEIQSYVEKPVKVDLSEQHHMGKVSV